MSGRWDDENINCDFKSIHCKLEQFQKDIQAVSENAGYSNEREYDMSVDGFVTEKRSLEDRIDLLQRELDALDDDGAEIGSSRGRAPFRSGSPGELGKLKGRTRSYQNLNRTARSSRRSSSGGCNCRCNTFLSDTKRASNPERDSQLQELRHELRDMNAAKQELQEKIFGFEETQRQTDNDTQMLRSQLESDQIRSSQMDQENDELREEIQRLEVALNNLPVADSETTRDAASQITGLLQTLNDDMVKAPELCNRLRMAAQQIMDGEKRLNSERSTRALDQVEVQYLRNENQRLRELAFRANMSAFQASVQLPQNQLAGYQQALGPPFGPGGGCFDPYGQQQGVEPRRKSVFRRVFGKRNDAGLPDAGPATLQFRDGSEAPFDPVLSMQQQRLSMAINENPDEAARRMQMLSQEKRGRGCCPR